MNFDRKKQITPETYGSMGDIFEALARNEISSREAANSVLCHPEYGGNRDDAKDVVEEWIAEINRREEESSLANSSPPYDLN